MLLEHNFICNNKNNVIELYGAFLYEINYAPYYMMCDYYYSYYYYYYILHV